MFPGRAATASDPPEQPPSAARRAVPCAPDMRVQEGVPLGTVEADSGCPYAGPRGPVPSYSGGRLSRLFFVVVPAVVLRNFRPAEVWAT